MKYVGYWIDESLHVKFKTKVASLGLKQKDVYVDLIKKFLREEIE